MKTLKFLFIFLLNLKFIFSQEYTTTVEILNEKNIQLKSKIENNLSEILNTLTEASFKNEKTIKLSSDVSTKYGINSINELWNSRKFRTIETELLVYLLKNPNNTKYDIRNVPLIQLDDDGENVFQSGIFTFTSDGKLDDIKFGLPEKDSKQFTRTGINVDDRSRRLLILDFIEDFRTAYDRKNLKYIKDVFSEDAIIIVGRVIKVEKGGIKLKGNVEDEKVELIEYSKKEYIKNLESVFKRNAFIKLKFDSIEITQSRVNNKIYAINLIQEWKSKNYQGGRYEDKGYLFVLIDFTNEEEPMIHVRAWEPYGNTNPDKKLVLGDFRIN